MKNENSESNNELAQKLAEKVLEKERGLASRINFIFQNRRVARNVILGIVFIIFIVLNLLSFKYL